MAAHGIRLLEDKDNLVVEVWQTFNGGRAALVTEASSYPTTLQLQIQGPGGTAISLGSNITANGLAMFDLPAGSYRMNIAGGTATNVYASLSTVPYC